MDSKTLNSAGTLGSDPGKFDWPNGVLLNKDNELYVCDSKNHSPWSKSAVNKNNRRQGIVSGIPDDLYFDDRWQLQQ